MAPTDASGPDTPVHPGSWYIFSRPVFFGHNEVCLLRGGDELFPRLIEAIGQALHEAEHDGMEDGHLPVLVRCGGHAVDTLGRMRGDHGRGSSQ